MTRRATLVVLLALAANGAAAQDGVRPIPFSENIPVPGGVEALARALGIESPGRALLIPEIARYLYRAPDRRNDEPSARVARFIRHLETVGPSAPSDLVPLPLDAATWNRSILRRPAGPRDLLLAIMTDRRAALMARGLASLDDSTLEFLAARPALVTQLTERSAAVFGTYARSLHVDRGRIAVPGGAEAEPLWEAVAGQRLDVPEDFIARLFERQNGRLAYLYDVIGSLDEPHTRFALGTWMSDRTIRQERFTALAKISAAAFTEFDPELRPLTRPAFDLAMLLARVGVGENGTPSAPADRALWGPVFEGLDSQDSGRPMVRETERGQLVDAAWLAERVLTLSVPGRRERLDVLSFGQRTFRSAPDGAVNDVAAALAGFGRFYALLLTLDRIQVTDPAMYVAAERRATALADLDGARFPTSLAQFQSALALVADIRRARTIDGPAAERLVQSLVAVDARDDGYRCGVAGWIDEVLMPSLPPRADAPDSVEARLLAAMSGIGSAAVSKPGSDVTWEGQTYRVDLAGAELRRVMYVRSKQGGPTLDDVMAFARGVRGLMALKAASASGSDLQRLTAAIAGHAALFDREQASTLSDALDALGRRSGTVVKVPADRVASLASLCDQALARVLMSVAYAMHLGNGDGSVLLGGDVSRRHDFGLKLAVAAQRRRMPWQIPVPQILPGVPWHVSGSVLALDVGLSSLALREVTAGRLAERPDAVREADRKAFSDAVALLDPRDLTDSGRAVIVETLTRGRAQVARLRDHPGEVDPVFAGVHSLRLDGLRQRAIRWTLVNDPLAIESWFSLSEVLVLGKPSTDLHAWGMSGIPFESCLCTRLQAQAPWHIFTGQLTAGVLPARITDLNLRVAEMSAALKVPAVLTRGILAAAVLDFLHDVRPSDGDDWMAFIRAARRLSRERIEDYTAALTANGPLVPMADRIEDRP